MGNASALVSALGCTEGEDDGPTQGIQSAVETYAPPQMAAGTLLNGRYQIEQLIGRGGMGEVYRVSDRHHPQRPVALKTLRKPEQTSIEVSFFKAEFDAMTKLRHPNVAAAYDFEAIEGTDAYLFTMEFVAGKDVLQATEGAHHLDVVALLVQICRALSYVHSRGVIHFDLKPANVLVTPEGKVKVLDFGLAGMKGQLDAGPSAAAPAYAFAGTPAYMAPELAGRVSIIDHRVDLYSLGILAFQLLCRRVPFWALTTRELLQMHAYKKVEFDEEAARALPQWLRDQVQRLCAKDPADRHPTANAVIEAFNRAGGTCFEIETDETKESYILSSRFIGRDAEFARIQGFISERLNPTGPRNRSSVLIIGGQSGLGKSRLLREARFHTQLSRIPFIEGNCYELAEDEYGGFAELLGHLVRRASAIGAADLLEHFGPELVKVAPQVAREHRFKASPPLDNAQAERLRVHEQISRFCVELGARSPYVLCLNNLHWAGAGTAQLLLHVVRRIFLQEREGRVACLAILGAFRDDEVDGKPMERLIGELERLGVLELVTLGPLGGSHVKQLLSSMLGLSELPQMFVARVAEETGGNPFFVEEVMRALVENGSVFLRDGVWAARESIAALEIPATVAGVFMRRASLLDPIDLALLEIIAVCGRPMSVATLAQAAELDSEVVHQGLARLHRRQMVNRPAATSSACRIGHDRMRETLYAHIEPCRRRGIHLRIGAALEQLEPQLVQDQPDLLAHHFRCAEDFPRAVHYAQFAAERARRLGRLTEAASFLTQAVACIDLSPSATAQRPLLLKLLSEQELVAEKLGAREQQQALIDRLLALVLETADPPTLGAVYTRQGDLHTVCKRYEAAQEVLEKALQLYRSVSDLSGERAVLNSLGLLYWQQGQNEEAVRLSQMALALDQKTGNRMNYARDLVSLAITLRSMGQTERARACIDELLYIDEVQQDPTLHLTFLNLQANIYHDIGDEARMMECQRRMFDMQDRQGLIQHKLITLAARAGLMYRAGKHEESLSSYAQILQSAREAGLAPELSNSLIAQGRVLLTLGRVEQGRDSLREGADILVDMGEIVNAASAWEEVAVACQRLPAHRGQAIEAWRRVCSLRSQCGDQQGELDSLTSLARLLRMEPLSRDDAAQRYEAALELARRLKDRAQEGALLNTLGILAWERGHYAQARLYYEEALRILEERGDRAHIGLLLNSLGVTVRKLGCPDEARALLERAVDINRQTQEHLLEGYAWSALGDVCRDVQDFARALACFESSLALRREAGDRKGEGWMLCRMAEALLDLVICKNLDMGQAEGARALAVHAHAIGDELADKELTAAAEKQQRLIEESVRERREQCQDTLSREPSV